MARRYLALLVRLWSAVGLLPAAAQQPASNVAELIDEFVVANRILADQGVIADGFGHLSVRSPVDHGRFLMSLARAAGLATPEGAIEFDLGGNLKGRRSSAWRTTAPRFSSAMVRELTITPRPV
jgi:hypothetical protein